ncbi:hypothetical protein Gogos_020591 [Gossypium gossypioides]|uniref:RNase H type-1 domain-containing protein n=1 Tax=Gossypium gossypioides TaxID=34282 RepID=A0A7J9D3P0_GOSGO|nr:hypothetical protein [Gossypium gossypioides]
MSREFERKLAKMNHAPFVGAVLRMLYMCLETVQLLRMFSYKLFPKTSDIISSQRGFFAKTEISMDLNEIIKVSFSWSNQFFLVHTVTLMMNNAILYVPFSPGTFVYLNTNGVVQTITDLSTAGGVIKDEMGKWILGYKRFLRKSSVFVAELWGILDGLLLLQKQSHDRVLILLDNLEAVKVICDRNSDVSSISLVRRIQHILFQEERWFIQYICRKDNQATDTLAKMVFANEEDLCLFEDSSLEIQKTLEEDITKGSLFPSSSLSSFVFPLDYLFTKNN